MFGIRFGRSPPGPDWQRCGQPSGRPFAKTYATGRTKHPLAYERPERDAALSRMAAEALRKRVEADNATADYRRRQRDKVLPALTDQPANPPSQPSPPETVIRVEVKQFGGIFFGCADTLVGVVGLLVAVAILIAVCGAS